MKRLSILLLTMAIAALLVVPVLSQQHDQNQPLTAAVDMGYVPFAFVNQNGQEVGFSIDLTAALAKRLGRPGYKIVSVPWSGIFAALDAGRVEFIVAPTNIRPSRAENMAFTEPYMDTGQLIAVNTKYEDTVKTYADLKDLTIGVNTGSVSDTWLTDNQAQYGFKIEHYDNLLDALLAVDSGRIDAVIGDYEAVAYAAKDRPNVAPAITIVGAETYGLPCRKDDLQFRDQLEAALEGLKLDGTLQGICEKWFGTEPGDYSSTNLVYVGYGVPGMDFFQETYHAPLMAPPASQ